MFLINHCFCWYNLPFSARWVTRFVLEITMGVGYNLFFLARPLFLLLKSRRSFLQSRCFFLKSSVFNELVAYIPTSDSTITVKCEPHDRMIIESLDWFKGKSKGNHGVCTINCSVFLWIVPETNPMIEQKGLVKWNHIWMKGPFLMLGVLV